MPVSKADDLDMAEPIVATKRPKKLLIITSSGGGGLLQAANAKEQEAKIHDPTVEVVKKDLLKDWMGKRFGGFCANRWNKAQVKGDVLAQKLCAWAQLSLAEYLFWPQIFCQALTTLFKEEIDEIIDTQCIGTSAILMALRVYNRSTGRNVVLQKILVDLPTKKATHFLSPIKRLSKKSRSLLQLNSIPPLLEEGQTAEEFWQTHCGLSEKEIVQGDLCVRLAFRSYRNRARPENPMLLKIRYKNSEELQLMRETYARGPIHASVRDGLVEFQVLPKDRVVTILLGSNPSKGATFNYMKNWVRLAKQANSPLHLFLFCADHVPGETSLLRKVAEFAANVKNYPSHLSIVPFSFQNEEAIAPLFYRSDITCTRSGGQTAMELMCVSQGEIWIHSEAKRKMGRELSPRDLLQGIPGWESESAVYLQKFRGAKIVTPETFFRFAEDLFRSKRALDLPSRSFESIA